MSSEAMNSIKKDVKATILAAGLGKRMNPLSSDYFPKPLFPLGGDIPMVETWVNKLAAWGVGEISMNLCVLSDTFKNYFGSRPLPNGRINFLDEQIPTGTLGGICKQALGDRAKLVYPEERRLDFPKFSGTTILAPSGDIVSNFDAADLQQMYEIHKSVGAAMTVVLTPVPWEMRGEYGTAIFGDVETLDGAISKSGKIIDFLEKDPNSTSNLNNASIYMIDMALLEYLDQFRTQCSLDADNPFYDFGKHVFPALLGKLDYIQLPEEFKLWGIQYDGEWFDVGRKRDYIEVHKNILKKELRLPLQYEEFAGGYIGRNVSIDVANTTIIPPVLIGNDCVIKPGATIGPFAVIGDGWTVEENARVANSVLWKDYSAISGKPYHTASLVRNGIAVNNSIVGEGVIEADLFEKVVSAANDGTVTTVDLDWIPDGKRE